jgi:release factor glutamine methyltransferase
VGASDASEAPLDVARANARRLGLDVEFRIGSWWQPWPGERFDVAVANPPYVAAGDPHLAALSHEPVNALVGGADGLDALAEIVAGAPGHLRRGGWLWLEHGHEQAESVRNLLGEAGFGCIETLADLAGQPRCTGGQAPPA